MHRLVMLVVLVIAFTPAAVLGALAYVVPAVVVVTAALAAGQLVLRQPAAESSDETRRERVRADG